MPTQRNYTQQEVNELISQERAAERKEVRGILLNCIGLEMAKPEFEELFDRFEEALSPKDL